MSDYQSYSHPIYIYINLWENLSNHLITWSWLINPYFYQIIWHNNYLKQSMSLSINLWINLSLHLSITWLNYPYMYQLIFPLISYCRWPGVSLSLVIKTSWRLYNVMKTKILIIILGCSLCLGGLRCCRS